MYSRRVRMKTALKLRGEKCLDLGFGRREDSEEVGAGSDRFL